MSELARECGCRADPYVFGHWHEAPVVPRVEPAGPGRWRVIT